MFRNNRKKQISIFNTSRVFVEKHDQKQEQKCENNEPAYEEEEIIVPEVELYKDNTRKYLPGEKLLLSINKGKLKKNKQSKKNKLLHPLHPNHPQFKLSPADVKRITKSLSSTINLLY